MRGRADSKTRWLLVSGVLAALLFEALELLSQQQTPGYSALRETISELAGTGAPHPETISAAFIVYGVLMVPLALGLRRALASRSLSTTLSRLMLTLGAGSIGVGVFHVDSQPTLHNISAGFIFISLLLAVPMLVRGCRCDPRWGRFLAVSLGIWALAFTFTALVGVDFFTNWFSGVSGLLERGFAFPMALWVAMLSLRLSRLTGRQGQRSQGLASAPAYSCTA